MKILVLILLLCSLVAAQTTKVIPLSSEDSAEAARLFQLQKDTEARIDALKNKIQQEYLVKNGTWIGNFWSGFEYSDDFKYVIPKALPPTNICSNYCPSGTTFSIPPGVYSYFGTSLLSTTNVN